MFYCLHIIRIYAISLLFAGKECLQGILQLGLSLNNDKNQTLIMNISLKHNDNINRLNDPTGQWSILHNNICMPFNFITFFKQHFFHIVSRVYMMLQQIITM